MDRAFQVHDQDASLKLAKDKNHPSFWICHFPSELVWISFLPRRFWVWNTKSYNYVKQALSRPMVALSKSLCILRGIRSHVAASQMMPRSRFLEARGFWCGFWISKRHIMLLPNWYLLFIHHFALKGRSQHYLPSLKLHGIWKNTCSFWDSFLAGVIFVSWSVLESNEAVKVAGSYTTNCRSQAQDQHSSIIFVQNWDTICRLRLLSHAYFLIYSSLHDVQFQQEVHLEHPAVKVSSVFWGANATSSRDSSQKPETRWTRSIA